MAYLEEIKKKGLLCVFIWSLQTIKFQT